MLRKGKVKGVASTIPVGVGTGVLICVLGTLIGAGVVAYLIGCEVLDEKAVSSASVIISVICAATGSFVSVKRVKAKRLQVSLLTGIFYYSSLIAMTALFFGGQYSGLGICALSILFGCGIVTAAGILIEKKHKNGIKKYAYR